jgi:hypothetical protein
MTRLYLPATLPRLAELDRGGVLDTVAALVAPDESEESEYDALVEAAEASADLVSGLAAGQRRRLVVVAEVAGEPGTISIADGVAVHADAADLPGHAHPADDLGWYATQEIPELLRGN